MISGWKTYEVDLMRPIMLISSEGRQLYFTRSDLAADHRKCLISCLNFSVDGRRPFTPVLLRFANHDKCLVAVFRCSILHSTVKFAFTLKIETMPEIESKVAEEKRF